MFDSRTARRVVGVSVRQINHWDSSGLVSPSAKPACGTGSRRLYTFDDLLVLAVVRALRGAGVSLARIQAILPAARRHLRKLDDGKRPVMLVAGDGGRVAMVRSTEEVQQRMDDADVAVVVGLSRLAQGLMGRIESVAEAAGVRVQEVEIGDGVYQVRVARERGGGLYAARCGAMPELVGLGESLGQAVEEFKRLVAERPEPSRRAPGAPRPRRAAVSTPATAPAPRGRPAKPKPSPKPEPKPTPKPKPKASTWGEGW